MECRLPRGLTSLQAHSVADGIGHNLCRIWGWGHLSPLPFSPCCHKTERERKRAPETEAEFLLPPWLMEASGCAQLAPGVGLGISSFLALT